MQGLWPEVSERTAFKHEVLSADGNFNASFQYEHEIVDGFALLVDDAGRVGLESFLVFHFYVEYHVLFQQTHQDRFRHDVRFESFNACGEENSMKSLTLQLAVLLATRFSIGQDNVVMSCRVFI